MPAQSPESNPDLALSLRTGAVQAKGLTIGLAIPCAAVLAVVGSDADFASWRPLITVALALAVVLSIAGWLGWAVVRRRQGSHALRFTANELRWTDESGRSRSARRDALEVKGHHEETEFRGRWRKRYELGGHDVDGHRFVIDLDRWEAQDGRPSWSRGEVAAQVTGWIRSGPGLRSGTVPVAERQAPLPVESQLRRSAASAPRGLVWAWYLFGLTTPVVSWLWLVERVSPETNIAAMPKALAYFWLLFVFVLILQPVIGRVVRSRRDMLLVVLGPSVSIGATHAFGGNVSHASYGESARWHLWIVETGTVHMLTVFLAFAVIAYVAPFTTGAFRWWDTNDLNYFTLRGLLALLVLIPALHYGQLLVVESLQAAGGSIWHTAGWAIAIMTETGTVLRRMLREAAL